ncbi:hypothetical protein KBC03_03575 [Patescibacteria group bacterium]|nr:hypothetical protein [Patescibacteria group bacterium]
MRNIPYFQKLLITVDGDSTSSAKVELSGTTNNLIKLPAIVGTNDVLKAPIGSFLNLTQLT